MNLKRNPQTCFKKPKPERHPAVRLLFYLCALCVLFLLPGSRVYAYDDEYGFTGYCTVQSGDWKFDVTYKGYYDEEDFYGENPIFDRIESAYVAGYTGGGSDLTLPAKVTVVLTGSFVGTAVEADITGIYFEAFENNKTITSVTIPACYRTIEGRAFQGCISLESVTFCEGSSMDSIGEEAFNGCISLASIVLPAGITGIGDSAFSGCTSLSQITWPEKLTTIGSYAFANCICIEQIVLPAKVVSIEHHAFSECTSLEAALLSENLVSLPWGCFSGCTSLKSVSLSRKTVEIEDDAFAYNPALQEIVYTGSKNNWLNITMDSDYNRALEKAVIRCSDGNYHEIHDFDNPTARKVTKAATCTKTGTEERTCRCGEKKEFEIPMKEHTPVEDAAVAATCTRTGLTEGRHCSACNKVLTAQQVIPARGHKEETLPAVAATCTKSGLTEGRRCSVCSTVLTAQTKIPVKGHSYSTKYTVDKKATFTADGSKSYHCKNCTAKKGVVTIYAVKNISLSKTDYVYNGKVRKPTVTVKDAKKKTVPKANYSIQFTTDQKTVGRHRVKITLKGKEYTGSKTLDYYIYPKTPAVSALKADKKAFTLRWKSVAKASGYEIQYARDAQFKKATSLKISNGSVTKTTVSKLGTTKKYYVRIRSYQVVNGKKYYSEWSAVKSVTTLK